MYAFRNALHNRIPETNLKTNNVVRTSQRTLFSISAATNLPKMFIETLVVVRVEGHTNAVCGGNADILLLRKCAGTAQSV